MLQRSPGRRTSPPKRLLRVMLNALNTFHPPQPPARMSDVEQETKPIVDEKPDVKGETHLNIKVSDGSSEIFFKIKRNTQLKRLMEAFAKRQGKSMDSIRFLCDGERINGDQTPDDLDLEDGDVIEAHQQQVSDYAVTLEGAVLTKIRSEGVNSIDGDRSTALVEGMFGQYIAEVI